MKYRLIGLALFGVSALVSLTFFAFVQQLFGWLPIVILCGAIVLLGMSFNVVSRWKDSRSPFVWDLDLNQQFRPPLRKVK